MIYIDLERSDLVLSKEKIKLLHMDLQRPVIGSGASLCGRARGGCASRAAPRITSTAAAAAAPNVAPAARRSKYIM